MAVLVCMAGSMVSGVVLSRHALSFLWIRTGQSQVGILYLLCAYWGLVMMSLHIGFHYSMMTGLVRKYAGKAQAGYSWLLRIAAAGIAVYGVIAFVSRRIGRYMFMKDSFVFYNFGEPIMFFFVDYIAVMGLFIFIDHYFTEFLKMRRTDGSKDF